MKNRMALCFEKCRKLGRPALIPYVTVGCPTLEESERLIERLILAGADMIEFGVPFSDPMADGPVIQRAGQIALKSGATLKGVLQVARNIRARHPETPLILFSYYNVLLRFGLNELGRELADIDVDGVLVVDLPLEERAEIAPLAEAGTTLIPLLSPATPAERRKKIVAGCGGFVYYITVRGVTGVRRTLPPELEDELDALRKQVPLPVAAGFGISDPEMARTVGKHADAVVVGSAVMAHIVDGDSDGAVELVGKIASALA